MVTVTNGSDPAVYPQANQQADIDPRTRRCYSLYDQFLHLNPMPVVRNADVTQVLLEQKPVQPNFGTVVQGLYTGQLKDPKAAMQDLKERADKELDRAIKAAQAKGAKVSRDDWSSPTGIRAKTSPRTITPPRSSATVGAALDTVAPTRERRMPMATRAAPRTARSLATPRRPLLPQIWAARWYYLFMAPALVLAVMFTLFPIVASWYYSFLDWSGFTSQQTWVGLANYRETLHDTYFWGAFKRSFLFMFASVPPRLILALLVALLLNDQALKLAPLFRTLFFIPVVTTAAIVGVVMTFLFSPFNGPIDKALLALGLIDRPIDFLGNPDTAMWTVVVVFIWKTSASR